MSRDKQEVDENANDNRNPVLPNKDKHNTTEIKVDGQPLIHNKPEQVVIEQDISEDVLFSSIETEIKPSDKKTKPRYCKLCGGLINESKTCTSCGKQYFRLPRIKPYPIVIGLLSVGLIVSIVVNLFQNSDRMNYYNQLLSSTALLEESNDVLSATLEKNNELINENNRYDELLEKWKTEVDDKGDELSRIKMEYSILENEWSDLLNYRSFFHVSAGIVPIDGNRIYHWLDCELLATDIFGWPTSEYYIFNTEYAEYLGYKACPICYGD